MATTGASMRWESNNDRRVSLKIGTLRKFSAFVMMNSSNNDCVVCTEQLNIAPLLLLQLLYLTPTPTHTPTPTPTATPTLCSTNVAFVNMR